MGFGQLLTILVLTACTSDATDATAAPSGSTAHTAIPSTAGPIPAATVARTREVSRPASPAAKVPSESTTSPAPTPPPVPGDSLPPGNVTSTVIPTSVSATDAPVALITPGATSTPAITPTPDLAPEATTRVPPHLTVTLPVVDAPPLPMSGTATTVPIANATPIPPVLTELPVPVAPTSTPAPVPPVPTEFPAPVAPTSTPSPASTPIPSVAKIDVEAPQVAEFRVEIKGWIPSVFATNHDNRGGTLFVLVDWGISEQWRSQPIDHATGQIFASNRYKFAGSYSVTIRVVSEFGVVGTTSLQINVLPEWVLPG